MSFRFLHVSDTHLGYAQYGLRQRAVDIARSLKAALQHGVDEGVDFILLCGDFFDRQNTNPDHFLHATDCLRIPLEAGIPVYAIAGNHDTTFWSRNSSWLDVLNETGHFDLLAPTFGADSIALDNWDETTRSGAVVHDPQGRYRIIGVPHLASRTEALIPALAEAVDSVHAAHEAHAPDGSGRPWTVMMMHLGLTGQVANSHDALEKTALEPLRGKVDYVALGHYHKRYDVDDWIHNPGGTEHRSSAEIDTEHGYYLVTVPDDGPHEIQFFEGLRRPYHLLSHRLRSDETRESLKDALLAMLDPVDMAPAPLIQVTLTGTITDAYARLDVNAIQKELTDETGALLVRLRSEAGRNDVHVPARPGAVDRATIEADVLRSRLAASWGELPATAADHIVRGILDLKAGALSGSDPEALYELLEQLDEAAPSEPGAPVATPEDAA